MPYKDFPWGRQSGQAASQGYAASFISQKLLALAFIVSSDPLLKVEELKKRAGSEATKKGAKQGLSELEEERKS